MNSWPANTPPAVVDKHGGDAGRGLPLREGDPVGCKSCVFISAPDAH